MDNLHRFQPPPAVIRSLFRSGFRLTAMVFVCLTAGALRAQPAVPGLTPALAAKIPASLNTLVLTKGGDGIQLPALVTLDGKPAAETTAARLRWDDRGLTVIFECADKNIKAGQRPRDAANIWEDDSVEVFLDIGRRRYTRDDNWKHVIVSAAGTVYDECGPLMFGRSGDPLKADTAWNLPGLETKAAKTANGWRAEIFIPWDSLGGEPETGEVWGFNLNRTNWPEQEYLGLFPTLGFFYNSERWGALFFTREPLADNPASLAELFKELHVLSVPKGPAGTVVDKWRTIGGAPFTGEETTATTRWDDRGLEIAVDCQDAQVKAGACPRDDMDNIWTKNDTVEVFLDIGNRRDPRSEKWMHLMLGASGTLADECGPMVWHPRSRTAYFICGQHDPGRRPQTPQGGNRQWNLPDLKAAAEKTKTGWRAQFFMPWKSLGGAPAAGDAWGYNLARNNYLAKGMEINCLAPTKSYFLNLERWGHLLFLEQPIQFPPRTPAPLAPRPGAAPKPGGNLVFNPDFGEKLAGWETGAMLVLTKVPTNHPGGEHIARDNDWGYWLKTFAAGEEQGGSVKQEGSRGNVYSFGPHSWLRSQPFAVDPAFRYRFTAEMRASAGNAWAVVEGYRWQPGVKPHAKAPRPEELQKIWRSQPLLFNEKTAWFLRDQEFANPPAQWGSAALEFPAAEQSVHERRAWRQVEFCRVYVEQAPGVTEFASSVLGDRSMMGKDAMGASGLQLDKVAVERVE